LVKIHYNTAGEYCHLFTNKNVSIDLVKEHWRKIEYAVHGRIRNFVSRPAAEPADVRNECIHALAMRPETIAEHAEILYYLAEAFVALHQIEVALALSYAEKAYSMAVQEKLPVTATKAGCLAIQCKVTNGCTEQAFWKDCNELHETVLKLMFARSLEVAEQNEISGLMFRLNTAGTRLAREGGFAAA